jgi:hypothetical protein
MSLNGINGQAPPQPAALNVTYHNLPRPNGVKIVVFTQTGQYIGDMEIEVASTASFPILAAVLGQYIQATAQAIQPVGAGMLAQLDRAARGK